MLRLPPLAAVLDVGAGNAGVGLVIADLVSELLISDSDRSHLECLRALARKRGIGRVAFREAPPERSLEVDGPFDVVLTSVRQRADERVLFDVIKPRGQLALSATGGPFSALNAKRRLLAAGFASASLFVPWPSARAPIAWVDLESSQAWHTLVNRWQPSARTPARAAFARVWQGLVSGAPQALRHVARCAAPSFCIVATR